MRDVELYQQILGLEEPWRVGDVELNIDEGRVDIHVEHPEGMKWKCPHCERDLSCYDHSPERTWRHLDTCQLETHLHARIPRVRCPKALGYRIIVKASLNFSALVATYSAS